MKYYWLAGLAAIASTQATAALGTPGISGEVSLLAGFAQYESNFNTDDAVKNAPLNSEGESDSGVTLFPLGQLRYTFGAENNQQVYLGTSREDIATGLIAFEIGYQFEVGHSSTMAFSILPTIVEDETWQDPFVVNQAKTETDTSGNALRFQYNNILDKGISFDLAYYDREVENEQSGASIAGPIDTERLKRDGKGIYSRILWSVSTGKTSTLQPDLKINRFSADGDAMSFNRYGVGLTYLTKQGRHGYAISGEYAFADYDEANPVFGKTQENHEMGVNFAYEYDQFMDWENWGLNALAGYGIVDSNIDFYNESQLFLGVGLSYKF
ncbi:DUF2860 domain-containing protein [Photobacterium atrarenae]|uniref:DUF2860 domain-containing protein n=1 Tax=Photobacterium atrarenae TaxID=865757 RepID=A0ABY5GJQ8_9GAMM|nr:DUF2860 domain-containing protein [Photobacterium atrarenae]UTV29557.1 DUF2860 domain-containing protein [Photobacterium atrarenae]